MHENALLLVSIIVVVGIFAQWLSWRVGIPSILLLLVTGVVIGPITGIIDPDAIFGELLQPIVALSVGLILYEGGLTLKMSDLPRVGQVVRNLVTIGALATWLVSTVAAHFILGLPATLSALLGAILVVTGPTVITPLLRHIRPRGVVGSIMKWEGIVIDPIGASLTVLVFEAINIGNTTEATSHIAIAILKTVAIGGGFGFVAAAILVLLLQRFWIPDHLQNAVSLMLVIAAFTGSNMLQHESGLLAATVMGFVLANQKRVDIEDIVEFKENLQVLLISMLFVILAARLELNDLTAIAIPGTIFVVILIAVARPLGVWISTLGSSLSKPERIFMALMAPRGIVAAAVASVLALKIEGHNPQGARALVAVTFITIILTVAFYGLVAPVIARRLGVSEANPQGIVFAGAGVWVRDIAQLLKKQGFRVLLIDSNYDNVQQARMAGLDAVRRSILGEHLVDAIDLAGIGRILAVTPNDWVNVLAVQRFTRVLGRANCYQIAWRPTQKQIEKHKHLLGRPLFGENITGAKLSRINERGFVAKATRLSDDFTYDDFQAQYDGAIVPLFVIDENDRLLVLTANQSPDPGPGQTIVAFVKTALQPGDSITPAS